MSFKSKCHEFYETFLSLKGTPHSLASGLALGVFVGVTPTIPLHSVIVCLLVLIFRRNLTAAYLGSWIISNPLTIPILYLSQYELGRYLLGLPRYRFNLEEYSIGTMARLGTELLVPLLTGGILMAPIFALVSYGIARRLISALHRGKRESA